MSTFKGFEEIEAWKKARELTRKVYSVSAKGSFTRDFSLKDQIRRASVSIMSNIAEGFGRGGTREFLQFLSTAKGSAAEVMSQLYVALDQEYIEKDNFKYIFSLADETGRMIGGLMNYLKKSNFRGPKYK